MRVARQELQDSVTVDAVDEFSESRVLLKSILIADHISILNSVSK
jgi:hypothetical protein